jgi:hypothetical protein
MPNRLVHGLFTTVSGITLPTNEARSQNGVFGFLTPFPSSYSTPSSNPESRVIETPTTQYPRSQPGADGRHCHIWYLGSFLAFSGTIFHAGLHKLGFVFRNHVFLKRPCRAWVANHFFRPPSPPIAGLVRPRRIARLRRRSRPACCYLRSEGRASARPLVVAVPASRLPPFFPYVKAKPLGATQRRKRPISASRTGAQRSRKRH